MGMGGGCICLFRWNAFRASELAGAQMQRSRNIRKRDWVTAPSNPTSTTLEVSEQSIWLYLVMKLMDFVFQLIYIFYFLLGYISGSIFVLLSHLAVMNEGRTLCCLVATNNINALLFHEYIIQQKTGNQANPVFSSHTWYALESNFATHPTVISNMLLPTELDTAMSPRPFRATITLVMRSGMDVPAARIVKPIISSETPTVSPTW